MDVHLKASEHAHPAWGKQSKTAKLLRSLVNSAIMPSSLYNIEKAKNVGLPYILDSVL